MDDEPEILIPLDVSDGGWDGGWTTHIDQFGREELIDKPVKIALQHVAADLISRRTGPVTVSILLCDDLTIQDLNQRYRDKDKPTDVLSFPQFNNAEAAAQAPGPCLLGDIILARETVMRDAKNREKSIDHHIRHLMVHGTLHLLGFDHLTDQEAEEMERLEDDILTGMGDPAPYET